MDGSLGAGAALSEVAPQGFRRRLRVVVNPVAGRRRRGLVQGVLERLRDRGLDLDLLETDGPGHARALALEAARLARRGEGADLLVVAGGDGTINEAADGLAAAGGAGLPLAILPLGTANVLASEIGLATRPDAVASAIAEGPARRISLGRATAGGEAHCFVLMAGVGFDAHVVERIDLGLKRLIGKGAYVWESLRQIARFDFPAYRVAVDGRSFQASSVIVANARSYAGPYVAAPDASLLAPGFQVVLFEGSGPLAVARSALALFRNELHRLPEVEIVAGRRVRIEGPEGDPVQGDGDTLCRLPVEIESLPGALDLVFPPE